MIPAQSRQIRTPSRRPGSARSFVPQPGQVPAADNAAVQARVAQVPLREGGTRVQVCCPHRAQVRFFDAQAVTTRGAAWRGPAAARSGR